MPPFLIAAIILLALTNNTYAQINNPWTTKQFTQADTLRGALSPLRSYDVTYYNLYIAVNPADSTIQGNVSITFRTQIPTPKIQIDLFSNLTIDHIQWHGKNCSYQRKYNAVFIDLPTTIPVGTTDSITVAYHGTPTIALSPPWDGGFVWATDSLNNPWIGVACEGIGASLWWPNKDHLSDEPDSMCIQCVVPNGLSCVSNGQLRRTTKPNNHQTQFDWYVSYPINNYNVTLNIAKYNHFTETYTSPTDHTTMPLDYYVLPYHQSKATHQFKQVPPMLACYETIFGKYPFWNDGFALVETPYLGMEHQGAIAYGNQYMNGYMGSRLPKGILFDYIIIHESGHEYFGNSVSCQDHADMWIHEAFTTYLEALYVECRYSYKDAVRYLLDQRPNIVNIEPMVGPYNVNFEDWVASDMYYKGSWMLHTLRSAVANDSLWFGTLKHFHEQYKYKTTNTNEVIAFFNAALGHNYTPFFEQYLHHPKIPVLQYEIVKKKRNYYFQYKWVADVPTFDMPFYIILNNNIVPIKPTTTTQQTLLLGKKIPPILYPLNSFYVNIQNVGQ
jgi:aminopeptidase N